jgi:hypothetical protein
MSLRAQSLKDIFTFTRASTATYFNAAGTLTTAAVDEPRIDYDPVTHACRGLLIEETRINDLLNSAALSTQNVTVTSGTYTLSFYGTGTVALAGTASPEVALVGTGASTRVSLTFTPASASPSTLTLAVSGSVLFAQLESGPHATSYIPTTTTAVTRAQDVCSTTTLTPWFDEDEGTIYVEYMIPYAHNAADTGSRYLVEAHDDSSDRQIAAYLNGGVRYSGTYATAASPTEQAAFNFSTFTAGVVQKQAYAWATDDIASIASGSALQTDTSATLPADLTTFTLGRSGSNPNGYIRKVKFYPRRLSNTELAALVA